MYMDEEIEFDDAIEPRDPDDFIADLATLIKSINFDIWRNHDSNYNYLERFCALVEGGKLHADHATQLLLMYFFPRYHRMLHHLLTSQQHKRPDIADWYLHWRSRIPNTLLGRGEVKDQLLIALRTMYYSMIGAHRKPKAQPASKKRDIPVPTPDLKRMSIAKWIEILAAQHDIAFAPIAGKRHESHQLYLFGDERIYFSDKVVFIFDSATKKYSPIRPGVLVNRCV